MVRIAIEIMCGLLHLLELDVQRLIDCGHVPHHHHRDRGHLLLSSQSEQSSLALDI